MKVQVKKIQALPVKIKQEIVLKRKRHIIVAGNLVRTQHVEYYAIMLAELQDVPLITLMVDLHQVLVTNIVHLQENIVKMQGININTMQQHSVAVH